MKKLKNPAVGHFPLRLPNDLRARIEKAAKDRNISLNAAILERLKGSFDIEDRLGGPRVVELIQTIATVMKAVGEHAAFMSDPSKLHNQGEWLAQPYGFEQAKQAAETILDAHRPPGEIVEPNAPMVFEGVGQTKVDPEALAAETLEMFKIFGRLMAAGELKKKREQDK